VMHCRTVSAAPCHRSKMVLNVQFVPTLFNTVTRKFAVSLGKSSWPSLRSYVTIVNICLAVRSLSELNMRLFGCPIGQQARWLEIFEEIDYSVQHCPGAKHSNADALFSRPISEQTSMQVSAVCKADRSHTRSPMTTSLATETIDWVSAQLGDPDVKFA
jgi:hypothetical protein